MEEPHCICVKSAEIFALIDNDASEGPLFFYLIMSFSLIYNPPPTHTHLRAFVFLAVFSSLSLSDLHNPLPSHQGLMAFIMAL